MRKTKNLKHRRNSIKSELDYLLQGTEKEDEIIQLGEWWNKVGKEQFKEYLNGN